MKYDLYHDKFAPLYDLFQHGIKGDVEFYLNYFKNSRGNILEIGAGTGRITIPLLKQGSNVTALDISPEMIKILQTKAVKTGLKVKTVKADMRDFKLQQKFGVIIVTFRTFQHLYQIKDQLKTLANIKRHLRPKGLLIFDVYNPNVKYIQAGNWRWQKKEHINLPRIRGKVRLDYRNRYNMAEQIMYQEYRFLYPDGSQQIVPLTMRFFFRFEIEHLLHLAGFKIKHLYGDFSKNKFTNQSPEMVWVAEV